MKLSRLVSIEDEERTLTCERYHPDIHNKTRRSDTVSLQVRYTCYSARGCSGKVLSNRDPHNCRVKSRGKSVYDSVANTCTDL